MKLIGGLVLSEVMAGVIAFVVLISDVNLTTESVVVVGGLLTVLGGVTTMLFKMLMAAKDERIVLAESQAKSYKEISDEALSHLETVANKHLGKNGKPKAAVVAPVIPEHSSPTTRKQQADADLQTTRARLVAATLYLDLPAREASEPADE